MDSSTQVTQQDLAAALREVGLYAGEVALVHSSLASMGWVVGGADTVIEAFLSVLDPTQGTLALPSLTGLDPNRTPGEPDRRLAEWDCECTPASVGRIPEVARARPDAVRSDHATHSVVAIGARAEELTRDHAPAWGRPGEWWAAPGAFGFGSPWEKLYEWDAHYLFLGVATTVDTIGHLAQSEFVRRVLEACGERRAEFEAQLSEYDRPRVWPNFDFALIEQWLQAKGAMRYVTVGEATLRATRARINVDAIIEKLETEPEVLLPPAFVAWLTAAREAAQRP